VPSPEPDVLSPDEEVEEKTSSRMRETVKFQSLFSPEK
jgi:hypothetical protein